MHIPIPFVDLDTLGLRRSRRHKKESTKLQESQHTDSKNKALAFLHPKIMMTLALTAFTSSTTRMIDSSVHCYQTRIIEYIGLLETNFDGSSSQLSPFVQIHLASQSNNEAYNLREMLQQPDKDEFIEAMKKEVGSLFKEKIWKKLPN